MPFPKTVAELVAAGYKYADTTKCRKCPAQILFYETPNGKMMPFNAHDRDNPAAEVLTHYATCPAAASFRKPGAAKARIKANTVPEGDEWNQVGPKW